MKKSIFTVLTTSLLVTGCNSKTDANTGFTPSVKILTEEASPSEVKTTIKTDFPENTSLIITASRDYSRKNNNEKYAINLYDEFNSIVKNGEISFSFNPLDKDWIKEYEDLRRKNGEFDKSLTEIDEKSIKDSIEISVLFTPKAEQPKNVVKIIGENGEKLKGTNVTANTGGFNVYQKQIKLYSKFKN